VNATSTKVVLASTRPNWYGGEEQLRLLALGLRSRGHEVRIMARRGGIFAERAKADGFAVFEFSGHALSPAALWNIRRDVRRFGPHVLHYNDSHALTGVGLAVAGLPIPARIAARRVDFPLHCARQYRWFADRVVCVSRAVAGVCRDGGIPAAMLRVVHDGVDPARARSGDRWRGRQSLALADDDILLLTVAKLTDHKGHRFLLDALPAVIRQFPRLTLALAGDGELRETLQQQAEGLGLLPHVRFLGYRNDVPDLIHAADAFVLPSHMEGLCTTLIDVMLAGRTIVTTTAGGIPDLVGPNDADGGPVAWLAPPRDPPALAEAIIRALSSPEPSAAMRERAQLRAERLFTADCMVEATLAVYREVLEKGSGVRSSSA
jgi:glycosyltransferase involved in cell wall biosynthesis